MKSLEYQPRVSLADSGFYRHALLTANELEAADFTLQMIADMKSPEREDQFIKITLALETGKIGAHISSRS